ncbi:hypothetical protein FE257_010304 [Aspergillus nanangensis]|uniref:FAD dependent oxidoreductase domain-containing protein n=1 Tax=Aspergillus nanangensis TaxID=2582783 RepID=A0AAD4GRD0_ASPNN|nr:hypothetical protein FE257_010304 [Aspergillus nanangensis]
MELPEPIVYHIKPTRLIPNSPKPLLLYKNCFFRDGKIDPVLAYDTFKNNGWDPQWVTRYGRHQRSHYHAESHEVMVVLSGPGAIRWGVADLDDDPEKHTYGDANEAGGLDMVANVGDVFVIPAGISHKNYDPHTANPDFRPLTGGAHVIESDDPRKLVGELPLVNFTMMGAYPQGFTWTWGEGGDHAGRFESVWNVLNPQLDPVVVTMDVAIIGSGIIGLMSALTLTDAGFKVTIIARDLPGDENQDWASPWAGAAIFPHPDVKGRDLQAATFRYFWSLAHRDPTSGVQVLDTTEFYDDRDNDSTIWYKELVPQYRRIPTEDLPRNAKLGFRFKSMTVNPAEFLPWIQKELVGRDVRFVRQTVQSIEAARDIAKCNIIVNATGLGAGDLVGDHSVIPVRGQTMFVNADFNELMMWQGSHYTYIIPRAGTKGVIVGGVSQEGNEDREVDHALRRDILTRVKSLAGGGLDALDLTRDIKRDIVAFRPSRQGGYRLETEEDAVHAYGFGSLGYTFCFGAAQKVRDLVQALHEGRKKLASRL